MKWYLEKLIEIASKPYIFFEKMPEDSWHDSSLSFALITGWLLSFALTVTVFINSYIPTGLSLIEDISGRKLAIAFPVLLVMGAAFFIMTLLIVGGIMILAILSLLFACGGMLNFLNILLGGVGNFFDTIKAMMFSSGFLLAGIFNILLMIPVKYKLMSPESWMLLEKAVYYLVSIYLFFVFAEVGMRVHKLPRFKALLAATIPLILLVLINVIVLAKVLPKIIGILG